jgi:uncharacterized membrane protein
VTGFTSLDTIALCVFAGAWFIYYSYVEHTPHGRRSLNSLMHEYRLEWMRQFQARESRILDGNLMGGLQNGTAFFASSAFLAIGGALSALSFADTVVEAFRAVPFGADMTRPMFETKVLGLAIIFAYSFFKFVWSYRLFNYVAILMGAMPPAGSKQKKDVEQAIQRAGRMNVSAARHFNRGLRAYFFALAYLGWFAGPLAFIATTLVVALVLWRRQFMSDSYAAATWTSAGEGS